MYCLLCFSLCVSESNKSNAKNLLLLTWNKISVCFMFQVVENVRSFVAHANLNNNDFCMEFQCHFAHCYPVISSFCNINGRFAKPLDSLGMSFNFSRSSPLRTQSPIVIEMGKTQFLPTHQPRQAISYLWLARNKRSGKIVRIV